jgi:hypothetical protein
VSHGIPIDPFPERKDPEDKYRKPTGPRWQQISKAEPMRYIEHPEPDLENHPVTWMCTVCVYNPPLVTWEMHEALQEECEAQSRAKELLAARIGEGGAETFDQVRVERDEFSKENDWLRTLLREAKERIEKLEQQQRRSTEPAKPEPAKPKRGLFR